MKCSNAILQCCATKFAYDYITPDNFALFPHPRSIKSKHVEVSCRSKESDLFHTKEVPKNIGVRK